MRKQKMPENDVFDLPKDEQIVLVGQPGTLRGELYVHNPGAERIVLRGSQLRGASLERGAATPAACRLPPIAVRPGGRRRVPLNIALPAHTPPGEYHYELEVGGHVRSVVLHVTEVVDLDISPPQVVIENRPGRKVTKRVVFHNLGNVPLTIGQVGAIPLDDELLQCRTGRAAVVMGGDRIASLDDYYAEVIRQTKTALEQTGLLRVRNKAGTVVLEPGQVQPIDLEILVPKGLEKHTRYRGAAAFYTADLEFFVVPSPGGETSEPKQLDQQPQA
jgi:hypothetical protein